MKLLLAFALLSAPAFAAAPPREDLKTLTAQLAKTPSDDALREKIIKLALKLKPAPALPEEAKRHMIRGGAAVKGAKDAADWKAAADEFAGATEAAPWSGDAYYNLAVAQDKAGDYDGALRVLKFAELAMPGSEDAKNFRYEVEFRKEKAASPAGKVRKEEEAVKSFDGAEFYLSNSAWTRIRVQGGDLVFRETRSTPGACLCYSRWGTTQCSGPVGESAECERLTMTGRRASKACKIPNCRLHWEISEDGEKIVATVDWPAAPPNSPDTFPTTYPRQR